jgi:pimeloyl-ACP methyl ester carboxylesterase
MPFVQAEGARLHYEEAGAGHPIVFVHEFGSDAREWEAQMRFFSRAYRCIAYNARGYPPSETPEDLTLYGWEHAVGDIAAILRGLSVPRAHVIGLSMGGYAALQFGLRHPDMATAIVAAGAGTGSAPSVRESWLKEAPAIARGFLERGMAAMAEDMGHGPTRIQLKRKDPRGWAQTMENLRAHSAQGMSNTMARYQAMRPSLHDFRDDFARMTIPVLLAVGDEDLRLAFGFAPTPATPSISRSPAPSMLKCRPSCRRPNAGHGPCARHSGEERRPSPQACQRQWR